MPFPLHTARLSIRPLSAADAADVLSLYGDPGVLRYWNSPPLDDLAEAGEWATGQAEAQCGRGFAQWHVSRRDNGAFAGCVGLQPLGDQVELLYAFVPPAWGHGFATEAAQAALRYAFREAGLPRVVAIAREANERSLRVLERAGMRPAGTATYWESEWLEYGLLAEEWRDGRARVAPPLVTPRLELRRFVPGDLPALAGVFGDPEVMRFVGESRQPLDAGRLAASQESVAGHWDAHGFGPLAVVERASGLLLGEAGLQVLEAGPDVELTYTLARRSWRRGFATEAARAVLRWAFAGLRLPRVVAVAYPENAASLRVLEKLGMAARGERDCYGARLAEYEATLACWRRGGERASPGLMC